MPGFTTLLQKFSEKALFLSVSVKEYRPYILTSEDVVASHNHLCPLKACRNHIVHISSSTEDLLRKLEDLSYLYQTVDCLHILYKHQFLGNILEESGCVFTQIDREVQPSYESNFVEKIPRVSKKRLSRNKFKGNLLRAEQRNVSTQTMGSSFLDRIQPLKNSKYESELTTLA